MAMVCARDIKTLTCSIDGSSNITIKIATFGVYNFTCSYTCCPPNHVRDCTEDAESTAPKFFKFLEMYCNGEPSCSVEFTGHSLNTECGGVEGDYLEIFYECSSKAEGPVAFMSVELNQTFLQQGQVVP